MPLSDCQVRDPRIRRTRQLLQTALNTLMQQRSFEEISVQDITEAATLHRATFYDHYNDKYALLEAIVAGGFHQLLAERQVTFTGQCLNEAAAIILAVCDYLTMMQSGVTSAEQSAFAPLVDAAIVTAVSRVFREGMRAPPSKASASSDMLAAALGWAIYGAAKQWFAVPERCASSVVVKHVLQLIGPMLEPHVRCPIRK